MARHQDPREGHYEQLFVHRPPGSSEYRSGPWVLMQMGTGGPLVYVHANGDTVPESAVVRAHRKAVGGE